ncbi:MAG: GNAT family N-acetyltransferase [Candidatus Celaenobacter polaris]|nr:GNAT family N-acetyltransferase [Candidatus Celaenobacter polaris]
MDKSKHFEITIQEASQQDIDTILKIWQNAELTHKPNGRDRKENLQKQIKLPKVRIFIAEIDKKFVGTVMVTHDGRKGWLNRLAVLQNYRKKGIAQKLIVHSEKWLASQGLEIYATLIDDPNNPSMNLFIKAGYTKHDDIVYFTKKLHPEV